DTSHYSISFKLSQDDLGYGTIQRRRLSAADSAPANSAPADSASANSSPTNSAPANSAPANSAPADSAPASLTFNFKNHLFSKKIMFSVA
ncbi:Hypothetical protein FKW44_010374, partial [Caligus rogercresseyi]